MSDEARDTITLPPQPLSRHGFRIAVVCALPIEAEMVQLVLDKTWNKDPYGRPYGKAQGDLNTYTFGVIGGHNVVLVHMPGIGGNKAASVAAHLGSSFLNIKIVFVAGICGVVPIHPDTGEEMVLGDCVISDTVVQYDFGRQYPGGFKRKIDIGGHGNASLATASFMAMLKTGPSKSDLMERIPIHLSKLQTKSSIKYPGIGQDQLFPANYKHTHRPVTNTCDECLPDLGTCKASCQKTGCDPQFLIRRVRLSDSTQETTYPLIHYGSIGSGNTVMKSGMDRDKHSASDDLIAFEMEGSGISDAFPTIVIKSACDYADSHKNKEWQDYAAATSATCLKAVLEKLDLPDQQEQPLIDPVQSPKQKKPIFIMPFTEDKDFIGREEILDKLFTSIEKKHPSFQLRLGLLGTGGVGKSQIAIQFGYQLPRRKPDFSVFWIHASTATRFEQSYQNLAKEAQIPIPEESETMETVCRWLSDKDNGQWLLILDNVDDDKTFTSPQGDNKVLRDFIPKAPHGIVLVTSRSKNAANNLLENNPLLVVEPMGPDESLKLLCTRVTLGPGEEELAKELVKSLDFLPLAITHAGAFIRNQQPLMSIKKYLQLYKDERTVSRVLDNSSIADARRDALVARTIIATWQISFEIIRKENKKAADLLALMSTFDNQSISKDLLLAAAQAMEKGKLDILAKDDVEEYLVILLGYSLLTTDSQGNSFKMHRLVQLSMTQWLQQKEEIELWRELSVLTLSDFFPGGEYETWTLCRELLPHAMKAIDYQNLSTTVETKAWLMHKLKRYLFGSSQFREANRVSNDALVMCKKYLAPGNPVTLIATTDLASTQLFLGLHSQAEQSLSQLVETYDILGIQNFESLEAQFWLGHCLTKQGKLSAAQKVLDRHLERMVTKYGREDEATVRTMSELATIKIDQRKYSDAEALLQEATEISSKLQGADHPDTLRMSGKLAEVLSFQGKFAESEKMLREVSTTQEKHLGPTHINTLVTLNRLGEALVRHGKPAEGEVVLRQVLEAGRHKHGDDFQNLSATSEWLRTALEDQGKYSEAETLFRELLSMQQVGSLGYTAARYSLARTLSMQNKFDEAKDLFRLSIKEFEDMLGKEHAETRICVEELCWVLEKEKLWEEAEPLRRDCITIAKDLGQRDTVNLLNALGTNLMNQKRYGEAEELYRKSLAQCHEGAGGDNVDTGLVLRQLCYALDKQSKWKEEELFRREHVALEEKTNGIEAEATLTALYELGRNLYKQRRFTEAEEILRKVLETDIDGEWEQKQQHRALEHICLTLEHQNRWSEAEKLRRELLTKAEQAHKAETTETKEELPILQWDLAANLFVQHRFEEAETIYKANRTEDKETLPISLTLYRRSLLYGHMPNLELLTDRLLESVAKDLPSDYVKFIMVDLHNLAEDLYDRGQYVHALPILQRVLENDKVGEDIRSEDTALSAQYLCKCLLKLGRNKEAEEARKLYDLAHSDIVDDDDSDSKSNKSKEDQMPGQEIRQQGNTRQQESDQNPQAHAFTSESITAEPDSIKEDTSSSMVIDASSSDSQKAKSKGLTKLWRRMTTTSPKK